MLGKKVKSVVRSWNSKDKKVIKSEKELSGSGEGELLYEYRVPGLNQEQADKIAEKRLAENTRHEISIEVSAPGDTSIDVRMKLQLSGTGTAFDQSYSIDTIEHAISFDGGYRMNIRGKSKSAKRGK